MSIRSMLPVLLAVLLAGCSGTVIMSPMDPATITSDYKAKTDTEGIIVYRAIPIVEVNRFTQVPVPVDPAKPDGATKLSGACNAVATRKILSVADTEHPYRLHYEHGLLEAYTFGATLTSDGILTVINTVSTPDQGKTLQNLASAASSAAVIAKAIVAAQPDCTVTPVFAGYERPPSGADIKDFGTIK
jgi:hypothetical protein